MAFLRRLVQARSANTPAIAAMFNIMMMESREDALPILLVAVEDVMSLEFINSSSPILLWLARPAVASAIAELWAREEGVTDSNRILARVYGEMVATHAVKDKTTEMHRDTARGRLISLLRYNPPSISQVKALINDIIRRCATCGPGEVDRTECMPFLPDMPDTRYTIQKKIFYELRGHILPAAMFTDKGTQQLWFNLSQLTSDHIDINQHDVDLTLRDDFNLIWRQQNVDTLYGFYEGVAMQNKQRMQIMIASALFTYLVSFTKQSNVTPCWIARRSRQFQQMIPNLNLSDFINEEVCRHFNSMYPQNTSTSYEIYKQLVMCWSHMTTRNVMPLSWILEQSKYSNNTSVSTIADVVSKMTFFDVKYLIDRGVTLANFTNFCELSKAVMRNPFAMLTVPPILLLRQYADLAYICAYIKRELINECPYEGYRGQLCLCSLSEASLKMLATDLWKISVECSSRLKDITAAYIESMRNKGYKIVTISGETFRYPVPKPQDVEGTGEQQPREAEASPSVVATDPDTLSANRIGWPEGAKCLPNNAELVSHKDMVDEILYQQDVRSKAFASICALVHSFNIQSPLKLIPDTAVTIPSPERKVPAQLQTDLAHFGIQVPNDWVNDEIPNNFAELTEAKGILPPRPTINVLIPQRADPAPQVQEQP